MSTPICSSISHRARGTAVAVAVFGTAKLGREALLRGEAGATPNGMEEDYIISGFGPVRNVRISPCFMLLHDK